MMKYAAVLFAIFIVVIVILADTGNMPHVITAVYDFKYGDKFGHFFLFGLLSFFITRATLSAYPTRPAFWVAVSAGLILALFVAAEEYSQKFFRQRTPDIFDLLAGYAGMLIGGWAACRRGLKSALP